MAVWEEIVDYTVPSNTTSVDFTGLNITKDDFIKINISDIVGSFYINDNTTSSNYYTQTLVADGSSVSAEKYTGSFITISGGYSWRFAYLKLSENGKMNVWFNEFDDGPNGIPDFRQIKSFITSTATFNQIDKITLSGTTPANARIQIYRLTAEKVADITVTSNTTQVDITGLNIDKGSEYLLVSDDKANVSHSLYIYPNNLTTSSNYYSQSIRTIDTSAFASRENTPRIHYHDGGQQSLILSNIKISNTSSFITQNEGLRNYGNGSTFRISKNNTSSTYENLSNVTSLKITSSATNGIGANSRFELYKLY